MTKTYTVTAERWQHGWELHVEGVGVTQCTALTDAPQTARDYLATELGGDPEHYGVKITHNLGGIETEIHAVRRRMTDAQRTIEQAAVEIRALAQRLRADGISVRDAAVILDMSPGRVSQLARPRSERAEPKGGHDPRTSMTLRIKPGRTGSGQFTIRTQAGEITAGGKRRTGSKRKQQPAPGADRKASA